MDPIELIFPMQLYIAELQMLEHDSRGPFGWLAGLEEPSFKEPS